MARRSTIEAHPCRSQIEFELSAGVSLRAVAAKYGVSKDACHRFTLKLQNDWREGIARGLQIETISADLASNRVDLLSLHAEAIQSHDVATAARIANHLHQTIKLSAECLKCLASILPAPSIGEPI
jgi:hypothetical protein